MKQMSPPVSAGGANAPGAVAGAAGGGDTATASTTATATAPASAVGIGSLTGLLAQLTEAIALLGKAIAGMQGAGPVGGGGPIQVPPGKGPIQGGGATTGGPYWPLRDQLAILESKPNYSQAHKAALDPIRAELAAMEAKAAQSGVSNPAASIRLSVMMDAAVMAPNDPRQAQLAQVVADARSQEARAEQTGSFNVIDIQRLATSHQTIMFPESMPR